MDSTIKYGRMTVRISDPAADVVEAFAARHGVTKAAAASILILKGAEAMGLPVET